MAARVITVRSVQELLEAVQAPAVSTIRIEEDLHEVPPFILQPGKEMLGAHRVPSVLSFSKASDGVQVQGNNTLCNLRLITEAHAHAVLLDSSTTDLGSTVLEDITTIGRVTMIASAPKTTGSLQVRGLHVEAADATAATDLPQGFGVSVQQGAFTLWITQRDSSVVADLLNLQVGRPGAPVHGSGVFVAGADFGVETLRVQRLSTGSVYTAGGIAEGTADKISGGVFVLQGVNADLVENCGPVTTYGVNDMALDNWGTVERWISRQKVTTFGTSGIGFVNFGKMDSLHVEAPIETHGRGARGFNVYDGTVREAVFEKITTRGDGAVGVQISRPVGRLRFRRGIETYGGTGLSLVKGVQQELQATALSVKAEGSVEELVIEGYLLTHGPDILPLEQAGSVLRFRIDGEFASKNGA